MSLLRSHYLWNRLLLSYKLFNITWQLPTKLFKKEWWQKGRLRLCQPNLQLLMLTLPLHKLPLSLCKLLLSLLLQQHPMLLYLLLPHLPLYLLNQLRLLLLLCRGGEEDHPSVTLRHNNNLALLLVPIPSVAHLLRHNHHLLQSDSPQEVGPLQLVALRPFRARSSSRS